MISTGLALAALSSAAFYVIYRKLPRRVRKFMCKHVLFTDAVACLLTYMLFGGTLVALFAAAWMGLITSLMLALVSNPQTNAILERFVVKVGQMKDGFISWLATSNTPQEEAPKLKVVR